ncbi:MAG: glycosyltransferase family 4 protein [Bacteroidetes bacterium]|nr:glycosyltransferase family 4 protein [Bacteroidota bacterium]
MNILIISDLTGGLGGVYTYFQQIQFFLSNDNSIRILLDLTTKKSISENYIFNSASFVPLSNKFHSEKTIIESVIKEIESFSPDIIHIVNGSLKSNLIIREFLSKSHISFIVTEQFVDDSLLMDERLLSRVQKVNSFVSHVIYVSNGNLKIANNIFRIKPENYSVIYNGIFPLKKKKNIYSQKPFRLFTIGRCVPQKGIDTIIKAISLLHGYDIEFHLLGDGEFNSEYLELAESVLNPNQQFSIDGWSKQIDYSALTNYFDLYISASRQEGLSYSLLEVATAGFPIVCSNCSGNIELVELCSRGKLFEKENFHQLSNIILDFINNPNELNDMAIFNTALIDEFFSIEKLIKKLEFIYKSNTLC